MNRLSRDKRLLILKLVCRHGGINDIADVVGCSTTTVRAQIAQMGKGCAVIHDRTVRGISPTRIELDELWSYVYLKRESRLWKRDNDKELGPRIRQPPTERGPRYSWIAHDPDTKLIISCHTGNRAFNDALAFTVDLNNRVVNRPMISSDAHGVYPDAIQRAFGDGMDHVVMRKKFRTWFNPQTGEKGNYLIGIEKDLQGSSKIDITLATTAHVERLNSNIRNFNARFTRQSYRFSKKLENHLHGLAIFMAYYNFVRPHFGFVGTEWKHCSPAMKAGLISSAWTYDDLLDEIDTALEFNCVDLLPTPRAVLAQYKKLGAKEWTDKPFLVSFSPRKHEAKVHAVHCRDCRRAAKGRKDGPRANEWYALKTRQEALKCAEAFAPVNFSVCSICVLGHYPGGIATGRGRRTEN